MEITVKQAIEKITDELKNDEAYYIGWQANIAMAFKDEFHRQAGNPGEMRHINSDELHVISNTAADNFLALLCRK